MMGSTLSPEGVAGGRLAGRPPPCFHCSVDEWARALAEMGEDERRVSLAFVAGRGLELPPDEVNEALRRAVVVRAVGGDPTRELELGETAVARLAEELDAPDRRAALAAALATLPRGDELAADPDLAWRCYAAGLLADELSRGDTER